MSEVVGRPTPSDARLLLGSAPPPHARGDARPYLESATSPGDAVPEYSGDARADALRPLEGSATSQRATGDPSPGAVADAGGRRDLEPASSPAPADAPRLLLEPTTSPTARADAAGHLEEMATASPSSPGDGERVCLWCRHGLTATQERWCSKKCRQSAWRFRRLSVVEDLGDTQKRLAYADPPYPGLARRYYRDEPTYAGEVDHGRLLELLATFDGWALSTSSKALRDLLPLCPPEAHLCIWGKPNGVSRRNRGPSNVHEALIVVPARRRPPGVRDFLLAKPARGGGTLLGRKPIAFCSWLFALLGAGQNDTLDDLFPGTGIVTKCWGEFVRAASLHREAVS